MPRPICLKCKNVNPIETWNIASGNLQVREPPQPVWACLNPTCLYKWARETLDEAA